MTVLGPHSRTFVGCPGVMMESLLLPTECSPCPSLCSLPTSLLTQPCRTASPCPCCPLPTSYPVAGAFAGGSAEISPFCLGSRASSMLVARQQHLAHHCNFRGWRRLPLPPPQHLESPTLNLYQCHFPPGSFCHPLDPDLTFTENPQSSRVMVFQKIPPSVCSHIQVLSLVLMYQQKSL